MLRLQVAQDLLHDPGLVVGVVDGEARVDADGRPVATQHPGAERVEGAHGDLATLLAHQREDALPHLGRGLVREGHGQDLPGRHALDADEVGDAVRQHAGLAGTGTREDEQRSLRRRDGAGLLGVEPLDDRRCQAPGIGRPLRLPPVVRPVARRRGLARGRGHHREPLGIIGGLESVAGLAALRSGAERSSTDGPGGRGRESGPAADPPGGPPGSGTDRFYGAPGRAGHRATAGFSEPSVAPPCAPLEVAASGSSDLASAVASVPEQQGPGARPEEIPDGGHGSGSRHDDRQDVGREQQHGDAHDDERGVDDDAARPCPVALAPEAIAHEVGRHHEAEIEGPDDEERGGHVRADDAGERSAQEQGDGRDLAEDADDDRGEGQGGETERALGISMMPPHRVCRSTIPSVSTSLHGPRSGAPRLPRLWARLTRAGLSAGRPTPRGSGGLRVPVHCGVYS